MIGAMRPGYGGWLRAVDTKADLQLEARGLGLDILCPRALQGPVSVPFP